MFNLANVQIGVIGLGYVGLPLAVEFGKKYKTIGYDINLNRVVELSSNQDSTLEVTQEELQQAQRLTYTNSLEELTECNVFIVTVPTPVDAHNRPDLMPLILASQALAKVVKKGDVVIYESTVYPGATEDDCIPVIEAGSGLKFNQDFYAGYSPERINPGDKQHRFTTIKKVTSGSTPVVADFVDALYASVVIAGTHKASSIKVAEASKVIENTQRDVNIALINELALIFNRMGIDTEEVLDAAGTKWNFLPFRPGLVGGHCISVDPYYLTHKAQALGYHPEVILAGRRINDEMGAYVANQVIKLMAQKRINTFNAKVLIMGFSFKENCPDVRNTGVIDILKKLREYRIEADVYDPWVNSDEVRHEYGIEMVGDLRESQYDAIILAVAHQQFISMGIDKIRELGHSECVVYDVKYLFQSGQTDGRL